MSDLSLEVNPNFGAHLCLRMRSEGVEHAAANKDAPVHVRAMSPNEIAREIVSKVIGILEGPSSPHTQG